MNELANEFLNAVRNAKEALSLDMMARIIAGELNKKDIKVFVERLKHAQI